MGKKQDWALRFQLLNLFVNLEGRLEHILNQSFKPWLAGPRDFVAAHTELTSLCALERCLGGKDGVTDVKHPLFLIPKSPLFGNSSCLAYPEVTSLKVVPGDVEWGSRLLSCSGLLQPDFCELSLLFFHLKLKPEALL